MRDLLDRVPAVTTGLIPAATGWDEGGDPAAPQDELGAYLGEVRTVAEAILDDAVGDVGRSAAGVEGEALALLAEARPVTASEAVDYLAMLERRLDPRQDMTMKNPNANRAHRTSLARAAGRAAQAIARGQGTRARQQLLWTRRFTDGNAPDWVAQPAAERLRLQVDLALGLTPRRR